MVALFALGMTPADEMCVADVGPHLYPQRGLASDLLGLGPDRGVLRKFDWRLCRRKKDERCCITLQNNGGCATRRGKYRAKFAADAGCHEAQKTFHSQLLRERDLIKKILNTTQSIDLGSDTRPAD